MKIEEIIQELQLKYFTYDAHKKELKSSGEGNETIAEFTKINDVLEKYKVAYTIININYIVIDT